MGLTSWRRSRLLLVSLAACLLAACPGIPDDDRYQPHDGGRSNTRALAPQQVLTDLA